MHIERKQYPLGTGQQAISYEVSDDNGHAVQLSASEALDLLDALNGLRDEIFHDMHPESAPKTFTQQHQPDESTRFRASWLDDL